MGVKLQRVENTFILITMCRQRPIKQRLLLQYVEDNILFNNMIKPHISLRVVLSLQIQGKCNAKTPTYIQPGIPFKIK